MTLEYNPDIPETRRQLILDLLSRQGSVETGELKILFGVSEDSIRRDLRELAKAGQLMRVHGGALPAAPVRHGFSLPDAENPAASSELAKIAASLLENGQVVYFDGGSTTLEISRQLDPSLKATVITTSPKHALVLNTYLNLEVILVGGRMNPNTQTVEGASVLTQLQEIRADVCFLGVCSIHPTLGVTASSYEEAQLKRQMVHASGETIAVIQAEKLGTAAAFHVCELSEISWLITESHLSHDQLQPYRQAGIEILQPEG